MAGLQSIYQPGYKYGKAGVMLLDIQSATDVQMELALYDENTLEVEVKSERLMTALDAINQRFGREAVTLASGGLHSKPSARGMKQELRAPGYTTDWDGLAVVNV